MRNSSISARPVLTVLLGGVLVAACCVDQSTSAQAFGLLGFGRGGFARPMGPPAARGPLPPPRIGGGIPGKPPRWGGPIIGGGVIGGGGIVAGGGGSASGKGHGSSGGGNNKSNNNNNNSNNNGRGATPVAQTDLPYVANEVIIAFAPDTTAQAIDQFARRYDLTQAETQNFPLINTSLYRWRIGGNRTVTSVINAAGSENIVASAQPNYYFTLQEEAAAATRGDASQYVLRELQIDKAHEIATGKDVLIAVIDSEIDGKHPDLGGTVTKGFDALGGGETPHLHGTEMAGAIGAHGKLLGIAPDARILAAHAFDDSAGIAKGTSYAIDKSLQWATDSGARIVNMSFAGPTDPTMRRLLAAANAKGIVLIAAAGNAGPQSEPLYPAADPNVIAVTATDSDDHIFKMANRGRHIAVAAPGVDIIALAPGGSYELSTGTSIAAAHVSGIAALLLERKPSLTPSDIRAILIATAKLPGPPKPDSDFGAGLVGAYRALAAVDRKPPGSDENAQAKQ
jgi:subtilisin family serine protease